MYTFDYEEAFDFAAIAARLGGNAVEVQTRLAATGMCGAPLGDVNGDGVTGQIDGNVVASDYPSVHLLPGSNQAGIEGTTLQPIRESVADNGFGQPVRMVDPHTQPSSSVATHTDLRPIRSPIRGQTAAGTARSPRGC